MSFLRLLPILFALVLLTNPVEAAPKAKSPYVLVLGIAQDGGYPQAGCVKACCQAVSKSRRRDVASLAIVDPQSGQQWLIDATPHFPQQLDALRARTGKSALDGILLTHAHIGHYAGLVHLGREVMGARQMPVYTMPRMTTFLTNNGPWNQLVTLKNIKLHALADGQPIQLNARIRVTPLVVPHRDEYSETVGFLVRGPSQAVVWLPDIDKWERWETAIETIIAKVDRAYLDGTFYDNLELPGRDMSQIPHPFIVESMRRFAKLPKAERKKVHFVHLNHTNPALQPNSSAQQAIDGQGYGVAQQGEIFGL